MRWSRQGQRKAAGTFAAVITFPAVLLRAVARPAREYDFTVFDRSAVVPAGSKIFGQTMTSIHLSPADFRRIARLHAEGIPTGFLSTMGPSFLAALYGAIARDEGSVVIVRRGEDGTVEGFVAGTLDTGGMYRRVLRKHWGGLIIAAAPSLLNPVRVRKMVETVWYGLAGAEGQRSEEKMDGAELLAIAVSRSCRGKGVGRQLVGQLGAWVATRGPLIQQSGSPSLRVVTWDGDPGSNAFYRACGFLLERRFVHHGNKMNEYARALDS